MQQRNVEGLTGKLTKIPVKMKDGNYLTGYTMNVVPYDMVPTVKNIEKRELCLKWENPQSREMKPDPLLIERT